LIKTFACLEAIFWGLSSFALVVFYAQVRNCFLLLAMPMRVVSGKSKPMRDGLCTRILRLRMPMDDIFF
jgi:hypothetical protein